MGVSHALTQHNRGACSYAVQAAVEDRVSELSGSQLASVLWLLAAADTQLCGTPLQAHLAAALTRLAPQMTPCELLDAAESGEPCRHHVLLPTV
jgi:hypothetical protein